MTNATQVPTNSREWSRWVESRIATVERSINSTATRIANEVAAGLLYGGEAAVSVGAITLWPTTTPPPGWLVCNGTAVSRTDYPALFALLNPVVGDVTITIASPAVATLANHGFQTGQMIYLTTTGVLPTGLTPNTLYRAIRVDANTFRFASSQANAQAGIAINTSGTQSGVHTVSMTWGVGDGSTTFTLPDFRGRVPIGLSPSDADFIATGMFGGTKSHAHSLSSNGWALTRILAGFSTLYARIKAVANWTATEVVTLPSSGTASTTSVGYGVELGGETDIASNLSPYRTVNFVIKAIPGAESGGGGGGGGGGGDVVSVNGKTGVVVLNTDDILEGATNHYFKEYVHDQPSPLISWTVNHNLGRKPEVGVYSTGSVQLMAEVIHQNENQTIINFVTATAGYARFT